MLGKDLYKKLWGLQEKTMHRQRPCQVLGNSLGERGNQLLL